MAAVSETGHVTGVADDRGGEYRPEPDDVGQRGLGRSHGLTDAFIDVGQLFVDPPQITQQLACELAPLGGDQPRSGGCLE